jgi:hypothetical protein
VSLQENVGVRLSYKAYASGAITANTEEDTASAPGASSAQQLRRVASTLNLRKNTYQSNEIRTDRQIADFRHGPHRVEGEISGELSPGTYWDFMEAVFRGTEAAVITKGPSHFTSIAATNGSSKFTAGGSTWAAQGFRVGDIIQFTGLSDSDNNSKNFQITALSTVDATVSPAPDTMTADTSFSVATVGKKIVIPVTDTDFVKRKFAFEHYHADVDVTQLFTECRMTNMRLNIPASGMATCSFGVLGRSMEVLTAGDSPYFSSPTAANTNGITAAVNGKIIFQGTAVGVITGVDINFNMEATAPEVVGQNFPPEIFLGVSNVTGNISYLFQDSTFLAAFNDETEVELLLNLTTTSAASSPIIGLAMTRVKLGSADAPLQGQAGIPGTSSFQALLKGSATGYDNTTIAIMDSAAS